MVGKPIFGTSHGPGWGHEGDWRAEMLGNAGHDFGRHQFWHDDLLGQDFSRRKPFDLGFVQQAERTFTCTTTVVVDHTRVM